NGGGYARSDLRRSRDRLARSLWGGHRLRYSRRPHPRTLQRLGEDISPLRSVNLHKLTGDRKGFWAMTINGPWRICFRFRNGDAAERILKREMKIRNLSANRLALALRLPSG